MVIHDVEYVIRDRENDMSNRKILRAVAKKNKVSVQEVKKEMQNAINTAYRREDKTNEIKSTQNLLERKNTIPTVDEVLNYARENIKKDKM